MSMPIAASITPPDALGLDERQLAHAAGLFRAQHERGRFPGGQLVVMRRGQVALNEAIGVARGFRPDEDERALPVTPDTKFCVFSASKPVLAMVCAWLEDRGLLDVHAPVTDCWPEFARHGKGDRTTLDVLTHRSGVLMPAFMRRLREWGDWDEVVRAVEDTQPTYPRGTLAYQPFEYGWILAEIVRRVSGRTVQEILAQDIAAPLGLERLRYGAAEDEQRTMARAYWVGGGQVQMAGMNVSRGFERRHNSPEYVSAFVPGAGIVTDAMTMARFYDALVADDGRVWKPGTVRRWTASSVFGYDRSNRVPLRIGRGFILGTLGPSVYGWLDSRGSFGHAGVFSTLTYGDWNTGLAVAIVTNGNAGHADLMFRMAPVAQALRRACVD